MSNEEVITLQEAAVYRQESALDRLLVVMASHVSEPALRDQFLNKAWDMISLLVDLECEVRLQEYMKKQEASLRRVAP